MDITKITDAFRTNIIEELGLEILPDEQKLRLLDKMASLAETRLMIRVGEKLSEAERAEFSNLMTEGDSEKIFAWLAGHGINVEEWLLEEVARLKSELQEQAKAVD